MAGQKTNGIKREGGFELHEYSGRCTCLTTNFNGPSGWLKVSSLKLNKITSHRLSLGVSQVRFPKMKTFPSGIRIKRDHLLIFRHLLLVGAFHCYKLIIQFTFNNLVYIFFNSTIKSSSSGRTPITKSLNVVR